NFVSRVARQTQRLPAFRREHVNVTRPAGVAVEGNLLPVRRPARTAHRRPVEERQLRLVRAVADGNPDLLGPRAIAHEGDAFAVRRYAEIALVAVHFDQRTGR